MAQNNNAPNSSLFELGPKPTIASALLPSNDAGSDWMEGQASRLKKQQAVIRSQGARIAELEQQMKVYKRPKQALDRMEDMRKRITELEQLSAVQARQMNNEFSRLVATMNELDQVKGKYSSRSGPQGDLTSTETYHSSVLRQHSRHLTETEVMEGKVVQLSKELQTLEMHAEATRLRNIETEQDGERRLTTLNLEITAKESELRNLQFQLQSAQTDLEWAASSKGTSEEKMASIEREYRRHEVEQHVQYLEIINKISEVQVEVEAAEKLQVEAQRDLESESRKMRVAFENHSIMTTMLKPSPISRGPQPAPPEPRDPTPPLQRPTGLSFDASATEPWWHEDGSARVNTQTQAGSPGQSPPQAPVSPYRTPQNMSTLGMT